MERNSLHDEIKATYSAFEFDGRVLFQIDTYGRTTRDIPGKKSQSIQLDREGARQLYDLLKTSFHFN